MRETRLMMGMPITVHIADKAARIGDADKVFSFFKEVDERFSPFKADNELSALNRGRLKLEQASPLFKEILRLCDATREETNGYFDIRRQDGSIDPSGLVKGWAILEASEIIARDGYRNFYVEAGGDVELRGLNRQGEQWNVGIRNPWKLDEIVKTVYLSGMGIATSGTYERGKHIYDPRGGYEKVDEIISLTVIGKNVYEADRMATAAFAMGKKGIEFIETLPGFEGYMIDKSGLATMTSGFEKYTHA